MKTWALLICLMAVLSGICAAGPAFADAYTVDFNDVMYTVWTESGIWPVVQSYHVLPDSFTLDPDLCDINGGFDISVTPVNLFPNGMLDSDEFALVAAILANPNFNCTATGGTSHQQVHDAWNQNFAQSYYDLGGGVGGYQQLLRMIPKVEYLFAVMMTIGDSDTMTFPMILMDLVVNNGTVHSVIGDPNVHVPEPSNYVLLYPYLGWCGDADGDGCSNLSEYQHYYPLGGRSAYIAAALDPNVAPPGCSGERMCDGTGGLWGEYFGTRYLNDLVATRVDSQISFDWGSGIPHPAVAANNFSVCWTGFVTPRFSEAYVFSVRTDDGVRLWVNNELIIDQWNDHGSTTYTGSTSAPLVADHPYPIRMEFYENGGDAVAWLGWESPSQAHKAIYEMYLTPGTGMGDRLKDWIRNPANGHFYRLTDEMTWPQGRDLAIMPDWHGYLATIDDDAENTWIRQAFYAATGDFFFGANDIQTEGRWVWAQNDANFWNGDYNGSGVPGVYSNWNSQEPNDAGGEDVAMFYMGTGKWNDLSVNRTMRCLVECDDGHINYSGPTPQSVVCFPWSRYLVSVEARNTLGTVSYQWRKDGDDIPGATNARYILEHATEADSGSYSCVISDESPATEVTPEAELFVYSASQLPTDSRIALGCLGFAILLISLRRFAAGAA